MPFPSVPTGYAPPQLLSGISTGYQIADDASLAAQLGIDLSAPDAQAKLDQARQYLAAGAPIETARYFINATTPVDTSGQAVGADGSPIGNYTNDQLAALSQNLQPGSTYLTDAEYQQQLERHYAFSDEAKRRLGIAAAAGIIGGGLAGGFGGASGGAAGGGSASTFPLASTGGPVTVTPIAAGSGATVPAAAGGAGAIGAAGAATSSIPAWVGNYLIPGLNAGLGYVAADRAADEMSDASAAAIAENRRQYDQSRADLLPWIESGGRALAELEDPNAFAASPDYNFRRGEGIRDIENTFASRGMGQSGNALRALTEFNSNLASGEYGNWYNRRLNRAGLGADTATNVAGLGAGASARTGNYLLGAGDARASGVLGRYTALTSGLNDSIYNALYRRRRAA